LISIGTAITILRNDQAWADDIARSNWRLCAVQVNFTRELAGDLVSATAPCDATQSTFHHPNWVISGEDLTQRLRPPHFEPVPLAAKTYGR